MLKFYKLPLANACKFQKNILVVKKSDEEFYFYNIIKRDTLVILGALNIMGPP